MTLADYLKQTGETHQQLADRIGDCSLGGLRKWLRGERIPQKDQMDRIVAATGGLVMPNDFYGYGTPGAAGQIINPVSRTFQARDCLRPVAGMVAPSPSLNGLAGHLSYSFGSSLNSSSVAGYGDSNVPFGPLGNVFAALRKIFGVLRKFFGARQPGRSTHV